MTMLSATIPGFIITLVIFLVKVASQPMRPGRREPQRLYYQHVEGRSVLVVRRRRDRVLSFDLVTPREADRAARSRQITVSTVSRHCRDTLLSLTRHSKEGQQ